MQELRSVNVVDLPRKKPNVRNQLPSKKKTWIKFLYFDAMVATINIGMSKVRMMLVDNGTSCDVLFMKAFSKRSDRYAC